ncbi:MAG: D-aminoacylase [Leptospiraceae bacterium]|nr:D-aminoacylase [Leptospiraceae bacterium]
MILKDKPDQSTPSLSRRAFLKRLGLTIGQAALVFACGPRLLRIRGQRFDSIISGGEIIDGSGNAAYQADLGIRDGRIQVIGDLEGNQCEQWIDARGLAVAPGFIDIHSHSDTTIATWPEAWSKIYQGVTSEIIGQDGRSLFPGQGATNAAAAQEMHSQLLQRGVGVNLRTMIGAGSLRAVVIGGQERKASQAEIEQMQTILQTGMQAGAWGLSSGLEYLPGAYADIAELSALARTAGIYSTHMRNEDDFVISAIDEAILIASQARVRLHISHIKAQGRPNWPKLEEMLGLLNRARATLPFVSCDRYPYLAYNTRLANLFPFELRPSPSALALFLQSRNNRKIIREQVHYKIDSLGGYKGILLNQVPGNRFGHLSGLSLAESALRESRDPWQLLCDILVENQGEGPMVGFGMDAENLTRLLQYPWCAIASDGAALRAGQFPGAHPRNFGSFPEVLGHYVRERGILSLEQAIYKMTGLPAEIMQIQKRGRIQRHWAADLVVFDPDQIQSRATYAEPDRYPRGIAHVLVNGRPAILDGQHTGGLYGTII